MSTYYVQQINNWSGETLVLLYRGFTRDQFIRAIKYDQQNYGGQYTYTEAPNRCIKRLFGYWPKDGELWPEVKR